jgi:hypothetical protein
VSKLDVSSSDACKQLTVLDFKMALFLCQRESAISGKEKETESVIDIVQDLFFSIFCERAFCLGLCMVV